MAIALDWRQMNPYYPYVDGLPYLDYANRDNDNNISFQLNMALKLGGSASAYWNYPWYLDWVCGSVSWYGALAKGWTTGHFGVIYMSDSSGWFRGTTRVGGQDTFMTFSVQHHDSEGHWGVKQFWNAPIPATTAPNTPTVFTDVSSDSVTISATTSGAGNYTRFDHWKFMCNGETKRIQTSELSASATFENLDASTNYTYEVQAVNTAGRRSSTKGSFRTLDDIIGYKITEDAIVPIRGWVIKPNGTKTRIKQVKEVE